MAIDFITSIFDSTLLFFIGLLFLSYWYLTKNHDYWKKKGIPYVKPYPIVGTLWENQLLPLSEIDIQRYRKYGRIYGFFEADKPVLVIGDPTLIRDILSKDFEIFSDRRVYTKADEMLNLSVAHLRGEDWKRVRAIASPVFTTGKLKRMLTILHECSRTLEQNFKNVAEKETPVDVKEYYGAFAMDTIASSVFSTKVDSHNDPNNKFVKNARETFSTQMRWRYFLHVLFPRIFNFFEIPAWKPEGIKFFADVAQKLAEERLNGKANNDFVQLLLDSAQEIEKEGLISKNFQTPMNDVRIGKIKNSTHNSFSKVISMKEFMAQCVIFFWAGYETSSLTLSYITYELALNQKVQEKLYQEVTDILEGTKGEITYEALQNMKYMDQIISEALRLYQSALRLERVTTADYTFQNPKLFIPKGTMVIIPTTAIHRDPEFFPNPDIFDPNRFTPEEIKKRNPYTYMPFGAGPRICIAQRFALLEIKTCLAHLIRQFEFERCPETKVPLEFMIGQRHLIAKNVLLKVKTRKYN